MHFSGFRAYSRKLLETLPFQKFSNDLYLHNLGFVKQRNLFIFSAIILINLYFYGIFPKNPTFGIILLFESMLLYANYINTSFFKSSLIFILLFFLLLLSFKNGFDKKLFNLTPLETSNLVSRHEYFAVEFGRLYKNRIAINYANSIRPVLLKFNGNLFSQLDFNLFFNVQNVISLALIPLFSLGIYRLSKNFNRYLVAYLLTVFIAGGFISAGGMYGYLLYVPFVNLVIYLGLLHLMELKQHDKD